MAGLTRFHEAQENVWPVAVTELRAGRKATHWIWFIFPQLTALGRSATALHYGIADLAEARAYLADPVLCARLDACAEAVLLHSGCQSACKTDPRSASNNDPSCVGEIRA